MGFLSGLGGFAGGVAQGLDRGQLLAQRAQQLQQGQMALEQAKKQLAADAAAFSGLGAISANQSQGGPQMAPPSLPGTPPVSPPAPGQSSMPMGHPGMPAGPVPSQAPPSQQAATPSAPPQQGGGGPFGGQIDPTDPRAPIQTVMQVAQEIKSRNPNIDPQTLLLATQRVIDLSKGLAPALRQGAQVVLQDMRDKAAQGRVDTQVSSRENIADKNVASREKIAAGHDATSLQRVQALGQDAMARAQFNQGQINQRVQSGQWSREKGVAYREKMSAAQTKLRTAQQQLSSLQNSMVSSDDPRMAEAQKRVQDAAGEIDRVNSAAGMGQAPAASAAPSGGSDQKFVEGQVYTDGNGNKARYQGGQFVPVP